MLALGVVQCSPTVRLFLRYGVREANLCSSPLKLCCLQVAPAEQLCGKGAASILQSFGRCPRSTNKQTNFQNNSMLHAQHQSHEYQSLSQNLLVMHGHKPCTCHTCAQHACEGFAFTAKVLGRFHADNPSAGIHNKVVVISSFSSHVSCRSKSCSA